MNNNKLKIKLHELGNSNYTLEVQRGVSSNAVFMNLTVDQLADLSKVLNTLLDKDTCCGDVCDFGGKQ